MRLIVLSLLSVVALVICSSCVARVEMKKLPTHHEGVNDVAWPSWKSGAFNQAHPLAPQEISLKEGRIMTYGQAADGQESFMVISERQDSQYPGIFPMRLCFLPTSILAGPSPYLKNTNKLLSPRGAFWEFSALNFRTTQFELRPAKVPAKGVIFYHSSIMLLSKVEERFITRMQARGWNIVVALPSDSLYRSRLPALRNSSGDLLDAARILAEDMDRHHAEQAFSTHAALAYLKKSRPTWLQKQKVLIGTSAGTFGLPAEVAKNPDWNAIVIVSGGTNLLATFESGAAGIFQSAMQWVSEVREEDTPDIQRIPTEEEYHMIYRNASKMTRLHARKLAPLLRNYRLLMIQGRLDRIIPKDQTRELYRALGKPERWSYPLGHHLVAVQLVLEADRLDHWLSTR